MQAWIIVTATYNPETGLPDIRIPCSAFDSPQNAEGPMRRLMEDEMIWRNEEGPEEEGWYYGITFDNWVAKFDENDDVQEYITLYTIKEIEV